jgi:hypothetical protein
MFDVVSTAAIVLGIVYGAMELHGIRKAREREALIELLHTFETPEYNQATALVRSLPDSASIEDIHAIAGDRMYQVTLLANTWETLGYLVQRRQIPLEFIEQAQGGTARSTWHKLRRYAMERRVATGRPSTMEWYQWLVEQLDRHHPQKSRIPAYVRHRDWQP